jgi:hypothetical protein
VGCSADIPRRSRIFCLCAQTGAPVA